METHTVASVKQSQVIAAMDGNNLRSLIGVHGNVLPVLETTVSTIPQLRNGVLGVVHHEGVTKIFFEWCPGSGTSRKRY